MPSLLKGLLAAAGNSNIVSPAADYFSPVLYTGNESARSITSGIDNDLVITKRLDDIGDYIFVDTQRGVGKTLNLVGRSANTTDGDTVTAFSTTGFSLGADTKVNETAAEYLALTIKQHSGFFAIVSWTGNGASSRSISHSLGVAPEWWVSQNLNTGGSWYVYIKGVVYNHANWWLNFMTLDGTHAAQSSSSFPAEPTSSVFTVAAFFNGNTVPFVAYMFASLAEVSKVGAYTGTGGTLPIDAGFITPARFVLIKRIENSGPWYMYDSARGIVVGNDPHLLLNSTAAEVDSTDYIERNSDGFTLTAAGDATVNISGQKYTYLAIA